MAAAGRGGSGGDPPDFSAQATAMASLASSMARMNQNLVQSLENQVEILQRLQQTLATVAESGEGPIAEAASGVSEATSNVVEMNSALEGLADTLGRTNTSMAQLEGSVAKAFDRPEPKKFKGLQAELAKGAMRFINQYKNATKTLLFFQGLAKGAENAINILKGGISIASSLASSLFNVGFAIASIPFQMMGKLIDFAAKATGGTEFAQARENVRKYFGDLTKGSSAMVMDVGKNMQGFVKGTGLSLYSVFGNAAEMLAYANEQAQAMGASFQLIMKGFGKEQQGTLFAFMKGLGLTGEEARSIGLYAVSTGKSAKTVFQDMTKMALQLEKAYGENAKVLGRDVGKAMKDVGVFGNATVETLMKGATYARGLGVELDHIKGTLGAFGTFEQAADNVSLLTQAFGVNIDTMELLQAGAGGDAAKQVDVLRKAMFSAGVSADKMNSYNLKLLASSTGLSEEVARTVFSINNQGRSLEDIQRQADMAKKKEEAYQETLRRLAPSIERVVRQFEMVGSFFEMFFKGMARALVMFGPFRDVVYDIRGALMNTFQIGFSFGTKFFGILENTFGLFTALHRFFKAGGVEKFFTTFSNVIEKFTRSLSGGKGDVQGLLNDMTSSLKAFFSENNPAFAGIADSFKKIMAVVGATIGAGIRAISPMVIGAIDSLIGMIANPEGTGKKLEAELGVMSPFVMPIYTALKENLPKIASKVGDLLWELLGLAWKELWKGRDFMPLSMSFGTALSTYMFVPAILKFGVGALFQSKAAEGIIKAINAAAGAADLGEAGAKIGTNFWKFSTEALTKQSITSAGWKNLLGGTAAVAAAGIIGFEVGKAIVDKMYEQADEAELKRKGLWQRYLESSAAPPSAEKLENLRKSAQDLEDQRVKVLMDVRETYDRMRRTRISQMKRSGEGDVDIDSIMPATMDPDRLIKFVEAEGSSATKALVDSYRNIEAQKNRAKQTLIDESKNLNEQQAKEAEKRSRDEALASLGNVTPENIQDRIKSFKDMAAKLTTDEIKGINTTMKTIQDAMNAIDWRVISPEKEKEFKEKLLQVKIFQDLVSSITTSVNAVIQANQVAWQFKPAWTVFATAMTGIFDSINSLFDPNAPRTAIGPPRSLEITNEAKANLKKADESIVAAASSLKNVSMGLKDAVGAINTVVATVPSGDAMKASLGRVAASLSDTMGSFSIFFGQNSSLYGSLATLGTPESGAMLVMQTSLGNVSKVMRAAAGQFDDIVSASKALFKSSTDLSKELSKLNGENFKVQASLDALGSKLGFSKEMTIRNDKVVINLEVAVDMRTDKLERMLVLRKDSIISDRLVFFTDKYIAKQETSNPADGVIGHLPPRPDSPVGAFMKDGSHEVSPR